MKLYRLQWDRDGRADLYATLPSNLKDVVSQARGVLAFHAIAGFYSINIECEPVTIYSESDGDAGGVLYTPAQAIDAEGLECANCGGELPELFPTANFGASLTVSRDAAFLSIEDDADDWGATASLRIPEESL